MMPGFNFYVHFTLLKTFFFFLFHLLKSLLNYFIYLYSKCCPPFFSPFPVNFTPITLPFALERVVPHSPTHPQLTTQSASPHPHVSSLCRIRCILSHLGQTWQSSATCVPAGYRLAHAWLVAQSLWALRGSYAIFWSCFPSLPIPFRSSPLPY